MQNILITGASGFLASFLVKELSLRPSYLVGLTRSIDSAEARNYRKVYTTIDDLVKKESTFDCIFHIASYIPPNNINSPDARLLRDNILLTAKLTEAYPNARFIYSSSVSVYGTPQGLPISINSPFNQPGYYGLSKLTGETIVSHHSNHCIIRFTSIIGPEMKRMTFVPSIIQSAKRDGEITLFGDGSRLQDYIDVRDAARLCHACSKSNVNMVTFGVSGKSFTNLEIAKEIQNHIPLTIKFTGNDTSPSFSFQLDNTYNEIGFISNFTLASTIKDMIE